MHDVLEKNAGMMRDARKREPGMKRDVYAGFSGERLDALLQRISGLRVGLVGDICLDVYWHADITLSELSRESPHFTLPVVRESMSPGGGGNVAANLAALKPKSVRTFGVVGSDWRRELLLRALTASGVDPSGLVTSSRTVTETFCKPMRHGLSPVVYEDPRIDFNNHAPLPREAEADLLESLDAAVAQLDVLCVCDQQQFGCVTEAVRERVARYAGQGLKVVVDSRYRIEQYAGVCLKPNEVEGMRAVGATYHADASFSDFQAAACRLAEMKGSRVCMTLGHRGSLVVERDRCVFVPAAPVAPPVDICGAGDSFLSAFSCALAVGAEMREAAFLGNLAAEVTIGKLATTGTASPAELADRLVARRVSNFETVGVEEELAAVVTASAVKNATPDGTEAAFDESIAPDAAIAPDAVIAAVAPATGNGGMGSHETVRILDNLLARYPDLQACRQDIQSAFELMEACYASGGQMLVCGNGGSAADAEHVVGELMKGFLLKRHIPTAVRERLVRMYPKEGDMLGDRLQQALPAISLVSQTALATAYANDIAGDMTFAQQVYGYGRKGDVLFALSTSGNSANVVNAAKVARAMGLPVIGMTGVNGGRLEVLVDVLIRVPASEGYRAQEYHLPIYHALCAMLESRFFGMS